MTWREHESRMNDVIKSKMYRKRETLKKKFNKLSNVKAVIENNDKKYNFVHNKSSSPLSDEEIELLSKGLKYKPKQRRQQIDDVIISVETAMRGLSLNKMAAIRNDVRNIFENYRPLESHNEAELAVIKKLREKDLFYVNPDKGKGVVVLNKEDYAESAMKHLREGPYEEVKVRRKFPVDTLQEKVKKGLKEIVDEGLLSEWTAKCLVKSNPVVPSLSVLPKIHKSGNKIRPVVSSINSPISSINKFLVGALKKMRGPNTRGIKKKK